MWDGLFSFQPAVKSTNMRCPFGDYLQCDCQRKFYCKNRKVASVTLHRCKSKRANPKNLTLPRRRFSKKKILAVILSHASANQHHAKLKAECAGIGFFDSIVVKYGHSYGVCHGQTEVAGNCLCMRNWKFRWLPALGRELEHRRKAGITGVLVMESRARRPNSNHDVLWLGWCRIRQPRGIAWVQVSHELLEGSNAISFTEHALVTSRRGDVPRERRRLGVVESGVPHASEARQ